jgi:hypothetical protein
MQFTCSASDETHIWLRGGSVGTFEELHFWHMLLIRLISCLWLTSFWPWVSVYLSVVQIAINDLFGTRFQTGISVARVSILTCLGRWATIFFQTCNSRRGCKWLYCCSTSFHSEKWKVIGSCCFSDFLHTRWQSQVWEDFKPATRYRRWYHSWFLYQVCTWVLFINLMLQYPFLDTPNNFHILWKSDSQIFLNELLVLCSGHLQEPSQCKSQTQRGQCNNFISFSSSIISKLYNSLWKNN